MSKKFMGLTVLALLLFGLVLGGCTRGSDGGSDGGVTYITNLVGALVDSPVVKAKVEVFDSTGKSVGTGTTGLGGSYSILITSGTAPFLVQFTNNGGAAFLDKDGNGVKDVTDPVWASVPMTSLAVKASGPQAVSGSAVTTLASQLAIALSGSTKVTPENATKARTIVQGLFMDFLAASGASDKFDIFMTPAAVKSGATEAEIRDAFIMRCIKAMIARLANCATNGALLPSAPLAALNDANLVNAIKVLAADLVDGKLDGIIPAGTMTKLQIPANVQAANTAAKMNAGAYSVCGMLTPEDVAALKSEMLNETPKAYKDGIPGFGPYVDGASGSAGNGVGRPLQTVPPAALRLNVTPNRVRQGNTDVISLNVMLLDANGAPLALPVTATNAIFTTTGQGQFQPIPNVTGYKPDTADTAKAGQTFTLGVRMRGMPSLTDSKVVKVYADTAANRNVPGSLSFTTIPDHIETSALDKDKCLTLSLIFQIRSVIDNSLLDNQGSVKLLLANNAMFKDKSKTKILSNVSSGKSTNVEVCLFDNVGGVLLDAMLANDESVKFSRNITVVDSCGKAWDVRMTLSTTSLSSSAATSVPVTIKLYDCAGAQFQGNTTVLLSVVKGTLAAGTLGGTPASSKSLNITVQNGLASGTVVYTPPASPSSTPEAFNAKAQTGAQASSIVPFAK